MNLTNALGEWSLRPGPLHQRLGDALRAAVERGDLPAGTRLPAERALARILAVSRSTVVAAYDTLCREGLVESRRGSGTYVRSAAVGRRVRSESVPRVRRSLAVGALVEGGGGAIELTAAALPANDVLTPDVAVRALADPEVARGNGYAPLGIASLRRAIAAHLTGGGLATCDEEVLVTSGAQQAIGLVAALYCRRGDRVMLESSTFPGAIDVVAGLGARPVLVPMDERGARVDALREAALELEPSLAYLIPTLHNPTGSVMPDDRRRELARIARDLDLPVIDDRTTADLVLEGAAPPPVAAFDPDAPVLTVGSMSKLFWGGLRVGWVRGPEAVVTRLARLKVVADLGTSAVSQAIAAVLLSRAPEVCELRRRQISASSALLADLLENLLPDWSWTMPRGGLTLWVRLPSGDAEELAQLALHHGVVVLPGPTVSPDQGHREFVRLPLLRDAETLEQGIGRLARAWAAYEPAGEPDRRRVLSVVV